MDIPFKFYDTSSMFINEIIRNLLRDEPKYEVYKISAQLDYSCQTANSSFRLKMKGSISKLI